MKSAEPLPSRHPVAETGKTTGKARRARRWKHVERAFTLAGIVMIGVLGWSAVRGFTELFRPLPPPTAASASAAQPAVPDPGSLLAAFEGGGHWQMAGWQWNLAMKPVAVENLDAEFEALTRRPVPRDLAPEVQEALGRLLEGLRRLSFHSITEGPVTTWALDDRAIKVRVVSRKEGDVESVIAIAAAFQRDSAGPWTLVELQSDPAPRTGTPRHLLPLPSGSVSTCCRTGPGGTTLFEIVESPVSLEELVDFWERNGWQSGGGQRQGRSASLLLARDGEVIQAWTLPGAGDGKYPIALLRADSPASEMGSTISSTRELK